MPYPLLLHRLAQALAFPLAVMGVIAAFTLLSIFEPHWWEPAAPALQVLRAANAVLAVIAVTLVVFRVSEAWGNREMRDRLGNLLFLGYIAAAALGSVQANFNDAPIGPVTAILTSLHVGVIALMLGWRRLDPTAPLDDGGSPRV